MQLEETVGLLEGLDRGAVQRLAAAVIAVHERGGTVFACGNGGSAATASHFCQDLAKSTLAGPADPRRLRVISLVDNLSGLTAWANDHGYDAVFEQPLRALAKPGDLLVAFSGSGNSPNVLNAVRWARQAGLDTSALTGFDGGELRRIAADGVHVGAGAMETAENVHMVVMHLVVCAVREWKRERDAAG